MVMMPSAAGRGAEDTACILERFGWRFGDLRPGPLPTGLPAHSPTLRVDGSSPNRASVSLRRTERAHPGSVTAVAVTGMANLAVRVGDVDAACDFYRGHGFEVRDRMSWNGTERADVFLGPVQITLFDRPVYADAVDLPSETFLHPALFVDDLDAQLAGHDVIWGPAVVSGTFGTRRIAFVNAPGGIRLEFMEQLEEPPPPGHTDSPPAANEDT